MSGQDKCGVFDRALKIGRALVGFDPARSGVKIPDHLRASLFVTFEYALNCPIPIPDLAATDAGISATLSFAGVPQHTYVPWFAVFSIQTEDGRGRVDDVEAWGDAVSDAMLNKMAARVAEEIEKPAPKRQPLRLVKGGKP